MRRPTALATPVAHLVGPGKLKLMNGRLAFATPDHTRPMLDPSRLRMVYCYGPVGISDEALGVLFRAGVAVSWLTAGGRLFLGRLAGADPAGTLLRVGQHRYLADPVQRCHLARQLVADKVASQLAAARHYQRQGKGAGPALATLRAMLDRIISADSLPILRGLEGNAAAAWFTFFAGALCPPWSFPGRVRRPPTDPVNALLSLGYTLLAQRVGVKLHSHGFEVALGALHEFLPGRPSLTCDVVEPFRTPAVDRWVLALCNGQRVGPSDFQREGAAVRLHPDRFASVLADWETFWAEGGFDALIESALTKLASLFRSALPPTPSDPPKNPGGSGVDETPDPTWS
jgi:CRISPR-associated protein Cas1